MSTQTQSNWNKITVSLAISFITASGTGLVAWGATQSQVENNTINIQRVEEHSLLRENRLYTRLSRIENKLDRLIEKR